MHVVNFRSHYFLGDFGNPRLLLGKLKRTPKNPGIVATARYMFPNVLIYVFYCLQRSNSWRSDWFLVVALTYAQMFYFLTCSITLFWSYCHWFYYIFTVPYIFTIFSRLEYVNLIFRYSFSGMGALRFNFIRKGIHARKK